MSQVDGPGSRTKGLDQLFLPRSVALVGASDDPTRIGGRPLRYLREGRYSGAIYPVNKTRTSVQGLPAFPDLAAVPEVPDVAILAVPANATPAAVAQCAALGVPAAVVLAAGFAEAGDEGRAAELEIMGIASDAGTRILGPNCLGVSNSEIGFYGTFASALDRGLPRPGGVGIASQSGAYGAHLGYLADQRGMGVTYSISTGNEADVDVADAVLWMALRTDVEVILAYVEGVRDGARFVEALDTARRTGTAVVMHKAGVSTAGSIAAGSHTAALAGADSAFDAILTQLGVHRVHSAEEQIDAGYVVSRLGSQRAERLGIVSVSGGFGIQMCDAAERHGIAVPPLKDEVQQQITSRLPFASGVNPVDVTAQALQDFDMLAHSLRAVFESAEFDAVAILLTTVPLARPFAEPLRSAILAGREGYEDVSVILVMLADPDVVRSYEEQGFLVFADADRAARALGAANRIGHRGGWAASEAAHERVPVDLPSGSPNEFDGLRMLAELGIPSPDHELVASVDDAVAAAEKVGFPVVLKVCSADILHKSDIGGVALGLRSAAEVEEAYRSVLARSTAARPDARIDGVLVSAMAPPGVEVIVGVSVDAVFGPLVMLGLGGVLVEVMNDVVFRLAPFDESEAARMLDGLRGRPLLDGVRGAEPSDVDALVSALVSVSRFAADHAGRLEDLEINPLRVLPRGVLALDVVVRAGARGGVDL